MGGSSLVVYLTIISARGSGPSIQRFFGKKIKRTLQYGPCHLSLKNISEIFSSRWPVRCCCRMLCGKRDIFLPRKNPSGIKQSIMFLCKPHLLRSQYYSSSSSRREGRGASSSFLKTPIPIKLWSRACPANHWRRHFCRSPRRSLLLLYWPELSVFCRPPDAFCACPIPKIN